MTTETTPVTEDIRMDAASSDLHSAEEGHGGYTFDRCPTCHPNDPRLRKPGVRILFALALWAEFGYGQPEDTTTRGPIPLMPENPYWTDAADRIIEALRVRGVSL